MAYKQERQRERLFGCVEDFERDYEGGASSTVHRCRALERGDD